MNKVLRQQSCFTLQYYIKKHFENYKLIELMKEESKYKFDRICNQLIEQTIDCVLLAVDSEIIEFLVKNCNINKNILRKTKKTDSKPFLRFLIENNVVIAS